MRQPGAQKHNFIPKVIQVSEGATENLQAASVFVEIALQRFGVFFGGGGVAYSLPLSHPQV